VQERGWEVTEAPPPAGLSAQQLNQLEQTLGEPLPPQLRHLLSWAGEWEFGWEIDEDDADELPEELDEISDGNLEWSAAQLAEENWRGQLQSWVEHHNDLLKQFHDAEQDALHANKAFWQGHFPFAVMPNGDLLCIDTRNPDPQQQAVRYFFHEFEGDSLDGVLLAPNLFSFISQLTALGCAGSEWFMGWGAFCPEADDERGIDSQSENARLWLNWLAQE